MLCIDGVTFGRSGPYGDSGVAILRAGMESDVYECHISVLWSSDHQIA